MKPFGTGTVGTGFVAMGWALSLGIVSIGMNAVGWVAIGLNAAGFVSVGLINSVGVFSFGGVNACGGWGSGGVNADGGHLFGLSVSVLGVVGLLVARVRSWPRHEEQGRLVSLADAVAATGLPARARIASVGEDVVVRDGATGVRAQAGPEVLRACVELGRGARVLVTFGQTHREVPSAGYREDAAALAPELVAIAKDLRQGFVRRLFGGAVGVNLACALLGLAAALVAFMRWR